VLCYGSILDSAWVVSEVKSVYRQEENLVPAG
jgi:hypothetical protein